MSKFLSVLRDKHALWYKSALFIFCLIVIVWCLPKQKSYRYEIAALQGKPWKFENLIAPYDFPIYKSETEVNSEKKEISSSSLDYYQFNDAAWRKKTAAYDTLIRHVDKETWLLGRRLLDSIGQKGIIEQREERLPSTKKEVMVIKDEIAVEQKLSNFFTLQTADSFLIAGVQAHKGPFRDSLLEILENCLVQTVYFDADLTQKTLQQDLDNILPTRNKILKGQTIVNKGEIVSNEIVNMLLSLEIEQGNKGAAVLDTFLLLVGEIIMTGLCLAMMFLYLAFFRKNIFAMNNHITFVFLLITLFIGVSSFIYHEKNISIYVIPFSIAPIIIRAFFDTRTALFAHLNIILLASFFAPEHFSFIFIELMGGVAAIFSIANLSRRSQLIFSAMVVFGIYGLAYSGLTLIFETQTRNLGISNFTVFLGSSLMILISYPLIFIFEKGFGFVSDFTLLELSDSNSPLLRELANKAPGTFQHSLQVSSLAEEVIQKIGGNSLLTRTGALYHDIGKLANPRYFTENQIAGANPHEELPYEESAHIIIQHVINGIEMARKAKLPEAIIDFIRTHHGTTLTKYFYKKSIHEIGVQQVDENKFRYPGPIPFSKETAVLMMADSVEASSRSLRSYDAVSIDDLVERIINSLMEEQQFINADITFREINQIKKIFKKRLMNIYHIRIEYPR